MNKVIIIGMFALVASAQVGQQETTCGGAEDVESPMCVGDASVRSHASATLFLSGGGSCCTGWIVKNPEGSIGALFFTAGHCSVLGQTITAYNEFVDQCGGQTARSTLLGQANSCTATLVEADADGDTFAIYELQAGCAFEDVEPIKLDAGVPDVSEGLYVIGHPNCRAQLLSHQEKHEEGNHCVMKGTFDRATGNKRARYYCDTQGGNSGSPVFSAKTGHAFAIHTNGGCSSSTSSGNSGALISNIVQKMEQYNIPYFNRATDDIARKNVFTARSVCPTDVVSYHADAVVSKEECEAKCINSIVCNGYEYDAVAKNCEINYNPSEAVACTGDFVFYERTNVTSITAVRQPTWEVTSGNCEVSNDCISSPGYPSTDAIEECEFKALKGGDITLGSTFILGASKLVMNNASVILDSAAFPTVLAVNDSFVWSGLPVVVSNDTNTTTTTTTTVVPTTSTTVASSSTTAPVFYGSDSSSDESEFESDDRRMLDDSSDDDVVFTTATTTTAAPQGWKICLSPVVEYHVDNIAAVTPRFNEDGSFLDSSASGTSLIMATVALFFFVL